MEIPKTVKENKDNDLLFRQDLLRECTKPQGKVYSNLEEATKDIKPEDIEYFTD